VAAAPARAGRRDMSQLNPFTAAILPSAQVQRQQSAERAGSVRRAQDARKVTTQGQTSDTFEHQVESADAITEANDQERRRGRNPQHSRPAPQEQGDATDQDQPPPRLDLTA
jgi:hypothetical protein